MFGNFRIEFPPAHRPASEYRQPALGVALQYLARQQSHHQERAHNRYVGRHSLRELEVEMRSEEAGESEVLGRLKRVLRQSERLK